MAASNLMKCFCINLNLLAKESRWFQFTQYKKSYSLAQLTQLLDTQNDQISIPVNMSWRSYFGSRCMKAVSHGHATPAGGELWSVGSRQFGNSTPPRVQTQCVGQLGKTRNSSTTSSVSSPSNSMAEKCQSRCFRFQSVLSGNVYLFNKTNYAAPQNSLHTLSGISQSPPVLQTGTWVQTVRLVSRRSYEFPELKEEDMEERHVRGSGPGGQSVNQTANCVVLKHKPTGIVVKCHESRSLDTNRVRARERLQEKVDFHLNGESSFLVLLRKQESAEKRKKKKKAQDRLTVKKAFKEREGLD